MITSSSQVKGRIGQLRDINEVHEIYRTIASGKRRRFDKGAQVRALIRT